MEYQSEHMTVEQAQFVARYNHSNSRAHIEAIVSRTKGRDGIIIRTMDGEIIKIIYHHPKQANIHRKRR